jgi:hypothetical protein
MVKQVSNQQLLVSTYGRDIMNLMRRAVTIVLPLGYLKLSRYTALEMPFGPQEAEATRIARQSEHEISKVVSPNHRPPLLPRRYLWFSLLSEAESTAGS